MRRLMTTFCLFLFLQLCGTQLLWSDPTQPAPPVFSGPKNRSVLLQQPREANNRINSPRVSARPEPLHRSRLDNAQPISGNRVTRWDSKKESSTFTDSVQPIVSLEVSGPSEINVGKTVQFTITVTNMGEVGARDVVVEAEVPPNAKTAGTIPLATSLGKGRLALDIGDLPRKTKKQLSVHVIPQTAGKLKLDAQVKFSTNTAITVAVRQPALEIRHIGPNEVVYGQRIKHNFVVSNTGDGVAENVRVILQIPSGLKLVGADNMSGKLGSILPGQSRHLNVETIVQEAGSLALDVDVRGEGGLAASVSEQLKVLRPMIDVSLKGPNVTYLNRSGVYELHVSNRGSAPAKNVQVTSNISTGLQIAAVEKPIQFSKSKNQLSWNLASLSAGSSEMLRIRLDARSEGSQRQAIVVRADHGLVAETEHLTQVISRADLRMSISDIPDPIEVGSVHTYSIKIENRGTRDAENVTVKLVMPKSMYAVESGEYMLREDGVSFPKLKISAGDERILRVKAIGNSAGDQILRAVMRSNALNREILTEESVFFYNTNRRRIATRP